MTLSTDYTNETPSYGEHPDAHNETNAAVNALVEQVDAIEPGPTFDERLAAIETRLAAVDLAAGVPTLDRANIAANTPLTSQRLTFGYIVPPANMTCTKIRTYSGTTAAAATPTLAQLAIYREETNGDLTLIGQTANTTSLWSVANTAYEPALQTPVALTAGKRYALAVLVVTAATAPNTPSTVNLVSAYAELAVAPRRGGFRTATTPTLVATIPPSGMNSYWIPYLVALP